MWQVLFAKFYLCIRNKFYMTSFSMTSFIYWCERVRKRCLSPPWQKNYNSPLANHIKCSGYFDKFSLLTHTDEQNLYFDNFFRKNCQSCAYRRANKTCHIKNCHSKTSSSVTGFTSQLTSSGHFKYIHQIVKFRSFESMHISEDWIAQSLFVFHL
jgi:hypothetical protein